MLLYTNCISFIKLLYDTALILAKHLQIFRDLKIFVTFTDTSALKKFIIKRKCQTKKKNFFLCTEKNNHLYFLYMTFTDIFVSFLFIFIKNFEKTNCHRI